MQELYLCMSIVLVYEYCTGVYILYLCVSIVLVCEYCTCV